MELNFVFLRAVTVRWYCSRAKNEKRQLPQKFDISAAVNYNAIKLRCAEDDAPYDKRKLHNYNFGVVQTTLSTV